MVERGVTWFSISDHDTLSAYGAFAVPDGVRVTTGIEINTTVGANEVHVLGYSVSLEHGPLHDLFLNNQHQRRARITTMVDRLRAAGYSITEAAVLREAQDAKSVGRPHVAKALIRAGEIPDVDYAFRHVLGRGKPGYVPSTYVTPAQAIDAIHRSGGIAVLAHPGRLKDRSIIADAVEWGIDGIEVFYRSHDAAQVTEFLALAARYGLVASAGSDFHDIRYHTQGVGMSVDDDAIAPFLRALEG